MSKIYESVMQPNKVLKPARYEDKADDIPKMSMDYCMQSIREDK